MGAKAAISSAVVQANDDGEELRLEVNGEELDFLIGKKGETLDAVQFLVNKMMGQAGEDRRPIVVDALGYRRRRAESLVELALRLSREVIETGKTVALNPMSPHDRRIIHMALRNTVGVVTQSEGEGVNRRLLIAPDLS
jgi:spoIIIJ-associated protein